MGNKAIANRRPTLEEIEFSKRTGTVDEARRRIINAGGYDIFQKIIDNPMFLGDLLKFHREYAADAISYSEFLKWLRENKLEKRLKFGSLEKQIKWQEIFYRKFYGKNFRIDQSRIFVSTERLLAIKEGLKIGCVDWALNISTPDQISETELQMTALEYAFYKLLEPAGIRIWADRGRERWTGVTLDEYLKTVIPVSPDDFNAQVLEESWPQECLRVYAKLGLPPMQKAGRNELIFTSSRQDIPYGQEVVNQKGETVNPDLRDIITAVKNNVKLATPEQEIILAGQMFVGNGNYLARNTWEFTSALLKHEGVSPGVSVAYAFSGGGGLCLNSGVADNSYGHRWRLAL